MSVPDDEEDPHLSANIVMQLFSPIVTSQRIMSCQFGNSYSSVQCNDGTSMVFDEYLGYLFMHIGTAEIESLKRTLSTCIVLVQHLCGPDVSMLKRVRGRAGLLTQLLDVWGHLRDSEQSFLIEAVEQLSVNPELSASTLKALLDAADSRGAQDLSAADVLFLGLMAEAAQPNLVSGESAQSESSGNGTQDEETETDGEFYSPHSSPSALKKLQLSPLPLDPGTLFRQDSEESKSPDALSGSHLVLLMGKPPGFNPHVVHIAPVADGVSLVMVGSSSMSAGLWESTHALNLLQSLQLQRDLTGVRHTADCLDVAVKKILEGLRKIRSQRPELERCHRQLTSSWDFLRKKYSELVRSPQDVECVLRVESCGAQFAELLCEVFRLVCMDQGTVSHSSDAARSAAKASLTINKYLEEFPGLVHFIYVDRSNHRVTTPSLDFSSEETISLTKKKIWSMVEFCRTHLVEGHIALMWKDTTFNYAYFLWFEDSQMSAGKVHCYELFCIHLGLATSSCVLEHTRRLAATIWEVTGAPGNPADLL
ncbi:hypothetical protein B566_EDAN010755 [Ephemera danica]|nr:hypothetical protein B566_EDAN010755 [Ephemera danica]